MLPLLLLFFLDDPNAGCSWLSHRGQSGQGSEGSIPLEGSGYC